LLVKFLDAGQDLSVQVHPSEGYAAGHPGAHLKSEAWYVMHAEPGARIYKGLKAGVTREAFEAGLRSGEVAGLLNAVPVRAGDCHYLPSGTVHALGAGILAAEVQTPSDTTFRVFDWNRLGADGKPRKLHVAEALECIDFSGGNVEEAGGKRSHVASVWTTVTRLVTCEHFTLERVRMVQGYEQEIPYSEAVVWVVLEGQGVISVKGSGPTAFAKGDTLLLLPGMEGAKVKMVTDGAWLEARVGATDEHRSAPTTLGTADERR
jgi:mannose-6-phosphate isomerase